METLKKTLTNTFSAGDTTPRTSHDDVSDGPHVEIDVPDPPNQTDPAEFSREPSVNLWKAPGPDGGSNSTRNSDSRGEVSLTLDPEIGTDHGRRESADAAHVSFEQPVRSNAGNETPTIWKSSPGFDERESVGTDDDDADVSGNGEVVKCSSNRSMQTPSMMRTRVRSRLIDPVHEKNNHTARKSSCLPKSNAA